MKCWGIFTKLEYKRSLKLLSGLLLYLLISIPILVVGVFCLGNLLEKAGALKPIEIAVVVPGEPDKATRLILQYISSMKSMQQACDVQLMEEEEARGLLQEGKLQAAILFPEQFYENIYYGERTTLTLLYPRNSSLNVKIFQELIYDGVSMVRTAETGVYAAMDAALEVPCEMGIGETGDYVAYSYGSLILKRGRLFSNILLSAAGDVDYIQYYFTGVFLAALLLLGMCLGDLYRGHSRTVEQRLKWYGVGCVRVSLTRILVMWVHLWFLGAFLYGAGCVCSRISDLQPVFWHEENLFWLGLPTLSIAAHHHMIYAMMGRSNRGSLVLFLTDLVMALCSGLIVPVAYLPFPVAVISGGLPLTWWSGLCLQIFYGNVTGMRILGMLLLIVVEAGIGTWILWKKA